MNAKIKVRLWGAGAAAAAFAVNLLPAPVAVAIELSAFDPSKLAQRKMLAVLGVSSANESMAWQDIRTARSSGGTHIAAKRAGAVVTSVTAVTAKHLGYRQAARQITRAAPWVSASVAAVIAYRETTRIGHRVMD
ncbi:MAG: hypothetical protein IPO08_18095 [Xanthomonadales bacterium]|jgi:hypothetical protein|nr:hypothetical protein [Xanthomonadales bacterium]